MLLSKVTEFNLDTVRSRQKSRPWLICNRLKPAIKHQSNSFLNANSNQIFQTTIKQFLKYKLKPDLLFLTSSSSKKTLVGCVDDGVDLQLGDVAAEDRHFVRQIGAVAGEIFLRFLWNLIKTNFVFNFV